MTKCILKVAGYPRGVAECYKTAQLMLAIVAYHCSSPRLSTELIIVDPTSSRPSPYHGLIATADTVCPHQCTTAE